MPTRLPGSPASTLLTEGSPRSRKAPFRQNLSGPREHCPSGSEARSWSWPPPALRRGSPPIIQTGFARTELWLMRERSLRVLVSGAGTSRATVARLLGRPGHEVTVAERDRGVKLPPTVLRGSPHTS
jgi:hypothetical protein